MTLANDNGWTESQARFRAAMAKSVDMTNQEWAQLATDLGEAARQPRRRDVIGMSKLPAGIGGAPTRPSTMPTDAATRKRSPIASGVLDYFPDAILAVAAVSFAGNEQHNPGKPLHWDRSKSTDESDALMRHFMERGIVDTDGHRHSAKVAWRALALLQKELESER